MSKLKPADEAAKNELNDFKMYRLKISLLDVDPPIWRRLEVFGGMEMDSLATTIDFIFGWSGDHRGGFEIKGRRIGDHTDWVLGKTRAEQRKESEERFKELYSKVQKTVKPPVSFKTGDLFEENAVAATDLDEENSETDELGEVPVLLELVKRARTKFIYTYDSGDNWEHTIKVEEILPPSASHSCPRCTDGARANPIEDCGGPWRYNELAEAAGDPKHEHYEELLDWVEKKWDPEKFSAEKTDRELAKFFKRPKQQSLP